MASSPTDILYGPGGAKQNSVSRDTETGRPLADPKSFKTRWQEARGLNRRHRRYYSGADSVNYNVEQRMTLDSIRLVGPEDPVYPEPTRREKAEDILIEAGAGLLSGFIPMWLFIPMLVTFIVSMFIVSTVAGAITLAILWMFGSLIFRDNEPPQRDSR